MKKLYKRKREYMMCYLSQNFGDRFKIQRQAAGLHLVAGFPSVTFMGKVVEYFHKRGIGVVPVESYSLCREGTHTHEVIWGYSYLGKEDVSKGVSILKGGL